jgi:hypothetical protein
VIDPPDQDAAFAFASLRPLPEPLPVKDWSIGATTKDRIAIRTAAAIQSRWFLRKYENGLAMKIFLEPC